LIWVCLIILSWSAGAYAGYMGELSKFNNHLLKDRKFSNVGIVVLDNAQADRNIIIQLFGSKVAKMSLDAGFSAADLLEKKNWVKLYRQGPVKYFFQDNKNIMIGLCLVALTLESQGKIGFVVGHIKTSGIDSYKVYALTDNYTFTRVDESGPTFAKRKGLLKTLIGDFGWHELPSAYRESLVKTSKKSGALPYKLNLDQYEEGDPLPEMGETAMIMFDKKTEKLYIGTTARGGSSITIKPINFPDKFTLSFDIYVWHASPSLKLVATSKKKEIKFSFSPSAGFVEFPNKMKTNRCIPEEGWSRVWLKRKGAAFKLYYKQRKGKEKQFIGSAALKKIPETLDTLVLSLDRYIGYQNIVVTAD
jgi:hypothetical protein